MRGRGGWEREQVGKSLNMLRKRERKTHASSVSSLVFFISFLTYFVEREEREREREKEKGTSRHQYDVPLIAFRRDVTKWSTSTITILF